MPLRNHTGWGFQVICSTDNGFSELNGVQMKKMHDLLTEALRRLIGFFDKNRITWFLAGGSALGAVRHQGFIPWDDDLDLCIPRKDYDRCIRLFKNSGLESYFHMIGPGCGIHECRAFLRFYIKGSVWKELFDCTYNEIPIDVFPLESVPESHAKMFFRAGLAFLLERISSCVFFFEQRKKKDVTDYLERTNPHNRRCFHLNAFIGAFFSFLPSRRWSQIYDLCMADDSPSAFASIPSGRNEYMKEMHPLSVFLPVTKGMFENIPVNLPHRADVYLTSLYGADYMTPPPESKREKHRPLRFFLPEDFTK